ncbi:MAG: hypothetical protein M1608_08095, partial [Candidatus Omnitrophica bacterium]|nr:hypothetical protein [Candidatus Omnitrophota bacterium]
YPTVLSQARIQAHYYTVNPQAAIANQPVGVVITVGQTASFSVTGSGPNLVYQWLKNGVEIPGATNAVYTTPPTVAGDNGAAFSVRVSNANNSVTSDNAILTVVTKPAGDYASTVLADSPYVYYRFNETSGTSAANQGTSGEPANGTYSSSGVTLGAPSASTALGTAMDLDGASGFVQVPDLGKRLSRCGSSGAPTRLTFSPCLPTTAMTPSSCI